MSGDPSARNGEAEAHAARLAAQMNGLPLDIAFAALASLMARALAALDDDKVEPALAMIVEAVRELVPIERKALRLHAERLEILQ